MSYWKSLFLGVIIELLIFCYFFITKFDLGNVFRYAARYSGRLSLIVYVYCFYLFTKAFIKNIELKDTKNAVNIFCVLHLIHFIFLALSVKLNNLPIIPVKITGGFLAYLIIIAYPLVIDKIIKPIYHFIYFYYVGIVFAMTYVARIKGDFVGAEPEFFHFLGLGSLIFTFIFFGFHIFNKNKP